MATHAALLAGRRSSKAKLLVGVFATRQVKRSAGSRGGVSSQQASSWVACMRASTADHPDLHTHPPAPRNPDPAG